MTINAMHPMYLAKAILPQLLARGKKSCIVITSSTFAQRPTGGVLTYSATKSLASFIGVGLSYELEGKVDVIAWEAGEVATKMSKKKPGF